jgi:hypothetical protein
MTSFKSPGNDDEAKRSPSDNSALGENLPRRPMATFDIDQQLSEDDDDDEYEDRPLMLEGSIAETRNQKSLAVDREKPHRWRLPLGWNASRLDRFCSNR